MSESKMTLADITSPAFLDQLDAYFRSHNHAPAATEALLNYIRMAALMSEHKAIRRVSPQTPERTHDNVIDIMRHKLDKIGVV